MAKKKDSPYVIGRRTNSWLKIKHSHNEEAIIAGFTEPRRSRQYFGALVLGVHKGGKLVYIGHTGTGFDNKGLKELYAKMKPLIVKTSPFTEKVPVNAPVTWVKPKLVAQIKFEEWTKDNHMRQPVYLGLRSDKPASSVTREKEIQMKKIKAKKTIEKKINSRGVKNSSENEFSNTDKIYFPKIKATKGDVIAYYDKIAPYILPHLKDRPESLNRHPGGVGKPNFFQKNFASPLPPFVASALIESESVNKKINYIVCQNKETLLYMANLGCIEINPWNSRVNRLDFPDYIIFDLDPKGSDWKNLVKVALELKEILDDACQKSYLKTSGKSGLHVAVPLGGKYHYDEVRDFSELIAKVVNHKLPEITSMERMPAKRKKKIYVDYLQNRIGQTTAAVYSLRPTDEATVSAPLKWSELTPSFDPKKFNIYSMEARLKKVGDLWKLLLTETFDLKKSIICLQKKLK